MRCTPTRLLIILTLCFISVFSVVPLSAAEPQRLTRDGKRKEAPVFVTADAVVFVVEETPKQVVLKRLRLKDGSQELLHPNQKGSQFDPAFSRDGRYHVFALLTPAAKNPPTVLVIQDRKGKQEYIFRPMQKGAVARGPSFFPDGSRVVFSLSERGGQQIASVDVQGKDLRKLTPAVGQNAAPAYSPDGKFIAFSSSRGGDLEIYVMDADGGNARRLTRSPGPDTRPAWSPDGQRLAFTSNRGGRSQIYVMKADGTGARRLTDGRNRDDYAAWHPDGKRLLYVSDRGGKSDLYLIEVPD